tara:strand:- start:118 stop:1044 length:927 start_codon:yes stop_codon:yes gene_type:complete
MPFKIVFMGTSDFAKEFLEHFYSQDNFSIAAVFTQPPRKSDRGQKIKLSPVHKFANEKKIKVFCPKKLTKEDSENLKKIKPDNLIVVAYGLILPLDFLVIPPCGAINIHASMLPKLRGAAPIERAILNGDSSTGISIMKIEKGLDEGPTYMQSEIQIGKNETYKDVYENLLEVGKKTVDKFFSNDFHLLAVEQNSKLATYAKKIDKKETEINFDKDVLDIHNKIRAFSPKPGAWFKLGSRKYKVFDSEIITNREVKKFNKNLILKSNKNLLVIKKIQKEGKNVMSIDEFGRGQNQELESIKNFFGYNE